MKARLIAFVLLFSVFPGCNPMKRGTDTAAVRQPTVVQVDNQGFLDMTIYAARSSQQRASSKGWRKSMRCR